MFELHVTEWMSLETSFRALSFFYPLGFLLSWFSSGYSEQTHIDSQQFTASAWAPILRVYG